MRSHRKEEGGVAAREAFKSVAVNAKAGASWRDFPHSLSLHAKARTCTSLTVQVPRGSLAAKTMVVVVLTIQWHPVDETIGTQLTSIELKKVGNFRTLF